MPIRQEKFQVSIPRYDDEDGQEWVFPSEKTPGGLADAGERKGVYHKRIVNNNAQGLVPTTMDLEGVVVQRRNIIPPTEIREPCIENHQISLSRIAGETDVSDYVATAQSLKDGFTHCPMVATDDQYTGQHVDLFYGTPRGSNDAHDEYDGFVERNNYLDRE
jgi:hypothetical protein